MFVTRARGPAHSRPDTFLTASFLFLFGIIVASKAGFCIIYSYFRQRAIFKKWMKSFWDGILSKAISSYLQLLVDFVSVIWFSAKNLVMKTLVSIYLEKIY